MLLFTGKGGVGKTTSAAATAVASARAGVATLVLSTDAAHSLGDALGHDLRDGSGDPVPIEPGLSGLQVRPRTQLGGTWAQVQSYLVDTLGVLGVDPAIAEEMTSLPGAEEIAALIAVREQVESGRWGLVVVDCAPTAETLRLLALPESLAWHLRRLAPGGVGLRRAARPAAAAALGIPLPGPRVLEIVTQWHADMLAVRRILGGEHASVRLVTTPETVVVAEARRLWTSLSLYGYAVDAVHVNKILPAPTASARGGSAGWLRAWNAAQEKGIAEIAESFDGVTILRSPYLEREPIGPDALVALAGPLPSATGLTPPSPMRVERVDHGFVLTISVPLAHAGEVGLKRRDEDLIVTVGEHRRIVTLPAALGRCRVDSAEVRAGALSVVFVPDPALWPK